MRKLLMMLVLAGGFGVACSKDGAVEVSNGLKYDVPEFGLPEGYLEPKFREDVVLTKAQQSLVAGTVDFSFDMLSKAVDVFDTKDNIVLSPLSASMALSMLVNGAEGQTGREMIDALGFAGAEVAAVNEYNRLLLDRLPDLDNTGIMSFANSLWLNSGFGSSGFDVYDSFRSGLTGDYGAVVHAFDFTDGPAVINKWCSDMTNGLIPEVLGNLSSADMLVLANALYFKGVWSDKFSEKLTAEEAFTNADGSVVQVDMMNSRRDAGYMSDEEFAIVELPYGNGAFRFQVILPASGLSADDCLAGLSGARWLEAQSAIKTKAVEMKLPEFKIEMNESLNDVLGALGITSMFSAADSDFSKLSKTPVVVSNVQQATSFSLDEEGTEAAAVTILSGVTDSGAEPEIPEYVPFHVNRPFLFLIKEVSTNVILFIGKVDEL